MLGKKKYISIRQKYFGESAREAKFNFSKYKEVKMGFDFNKIVEFVDCPMAQPAPKCVPVCCKKEGTAPMRYNDNYAHASVNAPQSDLATSRDYFMRRLKEVSSTLGDLAEKFNLHVDNTPKNFKDLIDAIKNDKFTLDPKVVKKFEALDDNDEDGKKYWFNMTYGIIWDGPKADQKGYEEAMEELSKAEDSARDAIMAAANAGDMKAAVEAFAAWTPTVGNA